MRTLLPLAAALALAGCITVYPPDEAPAASGAATAGFGQTARAGRLRVIPLALLEDSRCPRAVSCVWAGQVRITARVAEGERTATRELTSGKPVAVGSGMLVLEAVAPSAPVAGQKLALSAYRFTFRRTANIMR